MKLQPIKKKTSLETLNFIEMILIDLENYDYNEKEIDYIISIIRNRLKSLC